jgi:hypothetical protein
MAEEFTGINTGTDVGRTIRYEMKNEDKAGA